jgi:hypothetical protein
LIPESDKAIITKPVKLAKPGELAVGEMGVCILLENKAGHVCGGRKP